MKKIAIFASIVTAIFLAMVVFDTNQVAVESTESGTRPHGSDGQYSSFEYGRSGMNRPLVAYRISAHSVPDQRKILCVFAIHGFEDAWYRDGEELVNIAHGVIDYFRDNPQVLGNYQLIVVPCANPDGLYEGWTCNGPGRCQISAGIDINMDFDYRFQVRTNPRNKTGARPFSSPEARALRDLVFKEKPGIIIDFHGWLCSAAGDKAIAEIFCRNLGLEYKDPDASIYGGFFSGWASQYAKAVLVEYPNPFTGQGPFDFRTDIQVETHGLVAHWGYTDKTISAITEIVDQGL